MITIKYFDLFSGVGGFRAAFEQIDGMECVGHCEIDKHADRSYRALFNTEGEWFCDDARAINTDKMPDFDLICGGFPCQSFSLAGLKKGFEDNRGTLFFEITRILRAKKPTIFCLENVPGLLCHEKGRTFSIILSALSDLGYSIEWAVLNSKDFGVPQSRKRVYIIGYLNERCAGKVLPIGETNGAAPLQRGTTTLPDQAFVDLTIGHPKITTTARCLTASYSNMTLSTHKAERSGVVRIRGNVKRGYHEAKPGDSITISYPNSNRLHTRVKPDCAHTIDTGGNEGVLTAANRIRRLTPRECFRLQGYREDQIDKILAVTSDRQAYKQAGNGVTVPVVHAIGVKLKAVWDEIMGGDSQ